MAETICSARTQSHNHPTEFRLPLAVQNMSEADQQTISIDTLIERIEREGAFRVLRRLSAPPHQGDLVRQPDRQLALLLVGRCGHHRHAPTGAGILATYDHRGIRDVAARLTSETSGNTPGGNSDTSDAGTTLLPLTALALKPFASRIRLIIGYDAACTMAVLIKESTDFATVPFVDLLEDIDWTEHGVDPSSLTDILMSRGVFVETGNAADTCRAMAAVLSQSMWPEATRAPLSQAQQTISRRSVRVEVSGPTYRHRDALKGRGYRWSDGTGKLRTGWFLTVPANIAAIEVAWISGSLGRYGVTALTRSLNGGIDDRVQRGSAATGDATQHPC